LKETIKPGLDLKFNSALFQTPLSLVHIRISSNIEFEYLGAETLVSFTELEHKEITHPHVNQLGPDGKD
jgi:hypothetical protein